MKKIMKLFVYVAAAAMALTSCQKNEIDGPVKKDVHFTINAGIETKTYISDNDDGTYTPSWKNGDQIGIFFTEPEEKVEKVDATFSNTKEDGPEASFEGKATVVGEGTFFAFYPQSAFNQHYGDETIRLDLSAAQKPTSTSFDPACDILVAKPCDYLADDETVVINDLYFARLMSVLKINLKGEFAQGEIVESLTFSVDGVDITGNAKVDYKNATITAWNNGNVDRNVVTASYAEDRYITIAEGNNAAYLVVAPTTIPDGTSLSFTLKTANYNISKTVSAPSDMTFTAGNLSVLNLTINEENCEAIVADTRIWVEGFDGETVNKTQTKPSESGVAGTGVSESLEYTYSSSNNNCNVRFNSNGQTSTNPFLYINESNASFTASKIKIANEDKLALSAMVKGNGLKLTVEYKESASSTWSSAGKITGTNSYAQGRVIFAVPTTATSLDIRLTGNGIMYVDDIVLESTDEEVPVVTLESISISNQITEYYVGDDFVKPTVTATYSDETTQDVTELATFSECDMNTVGGKTVTVTYEGKTAEYNFTVKEKGASSETVEWVATSFADLKEGDQVVIVSTNGSKIYAMSNNNGTGSAPTAVAETYANDKLSNDPEETIVWYVSVDGDSRVFYTASDKSKWLYCTNTNNGVRVGTNTNKKFEFKSNYLYHTETSRYIGVYNGQDWRCYTSTTTNIGGQTFQFFVKQGGSSEGGGESPSEPETPVYSSLAELVAAGAPTTEGHEVTVTLKNEEITGIYVTSSGYRNGVFLQVGEQEIEIYSRNVPEDWVVGGTISGTLTNCDWKLYNSTWELCPANWSELTYTAPEEPKEPVQLVMSEVNCTEQTENSLTFTWGAVANATGYEVTCNSDTKTVDATTYTYTAVGLTAGTEYEISVKAVGDGTNYTTSEPKTAKGTTKAAEQGGGDESEQRVVTFDYKGVATNTNYKGETIDGVELSGTNISTNKDGQLRVYAGSGEFTLDAGSQKITKIELTFSGSNTGTFTTSGYSDGVWTGSQSKVNFKNSGKQARITKIVVTVN